MTEEEWVDAYCEDFHRKQKEHAELMHFGSVCILSGKSDEFIETLYQRSLAAINNHGNGQQQSESEPDS